MNTFKENNSWLFLERNVRFGESDSAGVIHFQNLFRWAHEAWEESLNSYGLAAEDIFPGCKSNTDNPKVALPIIHSSADFVIPIRTGQVLQIDIKPEKINPGSFQVISNFNYENKLAARVLVRHVAISTDTRKHCLLPKNIQLWLEASSIGDTVKPL